MISEQAKIGFEHIFKKAVMANITVSPDDICEIEAINNPEEISEGEFSVLTISSTSFRLLTLFHFNNNAATKKYLKRIPVLLSSPKSKSKMTAYFSIFSKSFVIFVVAP